MLDLKATRQNLLPTTNRFARPDVAQLAHKLRLETIAAPPSPGRDDCVELTIREELDRGVVHALTEYNAQLEIYARRLKDASDATVAVQIEQEASTGRVAFRGLVDRRVTELDGLEKRFAFMQRQLDRFVADNRLHDVSPLMLTFANRCVGAAILVILWLVEAMANSFFFAEGSTAGLLGGFLQACSLSAINIVVAFLTSIVIVPYTRHVRLAKRTLGILGVTVGLAATLFINFVIGHYRDAFASTLGVDPDFRQVLAGLLQDPLKLQSVNSWVLLVVGVLLAFLTMWKASALRDPYPGYGRLAERHERLRQGVDDARYAALDELQETHDDAAQKLDERLRALTQAQEQRQLALLSRERLRNECSTFLNGVQDDYRRLLAIYQDALGRAVIARPYETPPIPPFPAEPPFDPTAVAEAIAAMKRAIRELDEEHEHASKRLRAPSNEETRA